VFVQLAFIQNNMLITPYKLQNADPIFQIITRIVDTYIFFKYGFFGRDEQNSANYRRAEYVNVALIPSSGTGYFLVFVLLQPGAVRHLCGWFALCGLVSKSNKASASSITDGFASNRTQTRFDLDVVPGTSICGRDEEAHSDFSSFSSSIHSHQQQKTKRWGDSEFDFGSSELNDLSELDEDDLGLLIERHYDSKSSNSSNKNNNNNNNAPRERDSSSSNRDASIEMRQSIEVTNPVVGVLASGGREGIKEGVGKDWNSV